MGFVGVALFAAESFPLSGKPHFDQVTDFDKDTVELTFVRTFTVRRSRMTGCIHQTIVCAFLRCRIRCVGNVMIGVGIYYHTEARRK